MTITIGADGEKAPAGLVRVHLARRRGGRSGGVPVMAVPVCSFPRVCDERSRDADANRRVEEAEASGRGRQDSVDVMMPASSLAREVSEVDTQMRVQVPSLVRTAITEPCTVAVWTVMV